MMADEEIKEIKRKLEELEGRISVLEELSQTKHEPVGKELSINEFILSKKPKDDLQRTLSIGCYLEKYQNLPLFNTRDLENGFKVAKEKAPQNIADKVQVNVKKGYMAEAKEKKDKLKTYYLTNTGEQFVENDFKKSK